MALKKISHKVSGKVLFGNEITYELLQEKIDDIRNKLYDIKAQDGKSQGGLKYAFLYLYKSFSPNSIEDLNILSPNLEGNLDDSRKRGLVNKYKVLRQALVLSGRKKDLKLRSILNNDKVHIDKIKKELKDS